MNEGKTREGRRADLVEASKAIGAQWADNTIQMVQAETLMKIEEIMEVGAAMPAEENAMLEEAEVVIGELLAIFVYKPELEQQFAARHKQAGSLLERLRRRSG